MLLAGGPILARSTELRRGQEQVGCDSSVMLYVVVVVVEDRLRECGVGGLVVRTMVVVTMTIVVVGTKVMMV